MFLAPIAKTAKFGCLVIWNQGLGGIMRFPTRWGSNSTFKASNSKHPQKNLVPRAKTPKFRCLVIWNRCTDQIKRSPARWGVKFHLQSLKFEAPTKNYALCNKTTKFKCLVIWNWVLTLTAWCCNVCTNQLYLQNGSQKDHVNWNYNIHVTYNMCFCKHEVPCEEYKLKCLP
jgi:hypothetical protein